MAIKIIIPIKPIDGRTIQYYRLSMSEHWVYINKITCIYHINTPYSMIDPNSSNGKALIDSWLVYEEPSCKGQFSKQYPIGRMPGWEYILKLNNSNNIFATEFEAAQEALKKLDQLIEDKQSAIKHMNRLKYSLFPILEK